MRSTPMKHAARLGDGSFFHRRTSRRAVLGGLGLGAATLLAGCAPARMLLRIEPEEFRGRGVRLEQVLRAFVLTVIPGAAPSSPHLARALTDPAYPFASYASFFADDLCARAERLHGTRRFDELSVEKRSAVVRDGLRRGGVTQRLYRGAILLTEVSVYAGIYDDDAGCPLIDFGGRGGLVPLDEQSYPDAERFLPRALTRDGNPLLAA